MSRDLAQKYRDLAQKSRDLAQKARGLAQNSRDLAEKSRDLLPKARDRAQKSGDLPQKSRDLAQKSVRQASGVVIVTGFGPGGNLRRGGKVAPEQRSNGETEAQYPDILFSRYQGFNIPSINGTTELHRFNGLALAAWWHPYTGRRRIIIIINILIIINRSTVAALLL